MVNCLSILAAKSKSTQVLTMDLGVIFAIAYGILSMINGIIGY
ncbi:MAG: hypothetical protein QNJ47_25380 [Nostocaceae cyanobacterium]|nr:hypothetical protein [Nostocaceae cyanobacterium]